MRALVVLLLIAGIARADDERVAAERAFRAGEKAYKAQNFGAAAQNFEEAYKHLPLPEIAFSAALAYRKQYRVEPKLETAKRSVELYRVYLDKVRKGGRVNDASDGIGEMQREVDKLTAAGQHAAAAAQIERTRIGVSPQLIEERDGTVHEIADLPAAGDVKVVTLLDGKPVPPFEMVEVAPGPHQIHVEAEGYLPKDTTERAVKGVSTVAEIVLVPEPAKISVDTDRGAKIRVDGRPVAGTSFELPAGRHVLAISRAGREPIAREVTVERGQELALHEALDKTGKRRAVPWLVAGGAVVAGLAVGSGVFALIENGRAEDELAKLEQGDQPPATADRYERLVDRRDRATTIMYISGGAALAIGGAAAALYFFDRPSDEWDPLESTCRHASLSIL